MLQKTCRDYEWGAHDLQHPLHRSAQWTAASSGLCLVETILCWAVFVQSDLLQWFLFKLCSTKVWQAFWVRPNRCLKELIVGYKKKSTALLISPGSMPKHPWMNPTGKGNPYPWHLFQRTIRTDREYKRSFKPRPCYLLTPVTHVPAGIQEHYGKPTCHLTTLLPRMLTRCCPQMHVIGKGKELLKNQSNVASDFLRSRNSLDTTGLAAAVSGQGFQESFPEEAKPTAPSPQRSKFSWWLCKPAYSGQGGRDRVHKPRTQAGSPKMH